LEPPFLCKNLLFDKRLGVRPISDIFGIVALGITAYNRIGKQAVYGNKQTNIAGCHAESAAGGKACSQDEYSIRKTRTTAIEEVECHGEYTRERA